MAVSKIKAPRKAEKIWYVYALIRPDTDEIFYVGKGSVHINGVDRIDSHEEQARKGVKSKKDDVIRELWAEGLQVQKRKLYETGNEADAVEYERALIRLMNANGNLANIQGGEPKSKFRSIMGGVEVGQTEKRQIDSRVDSSDLVHLDKRITDNMTERKYLTLKEYRVRLGWSINRLAREAGVVREAAANAEAGRPIRAETAKALADTLSRAYGRTIDVLEIEGLNIL